MRKIMLVAALAGGVFTQGATIAAADQLASPIDTDPNKINISCYRGALKNTIAWDRPNAVFIEDLRQLGYDYTQASMIGDLLCRDQRGLHDGEYRINALKRLLRDNPPAH